MSLNPRNLVVICINGQTMRNLATNGLEPDSVPVPGAFELISHLVTHCVGLDNVCLMFTHVGRQSEKNTINDWLTKNKFFNKSSLHYRSKNIAFLYAKADESAAAVYANELLTDVHGHILVVSACWSELSHFESQDGAVTRIFLNPAPEEESNYVHSMGTYLFREWEDVSKQLKEFLKL